jgi:hypothetical protein
MALAAILDSVDSLNEVLKGEYRPGTKEEGTEGKFVLDVTPHASGFALENIQTLKNSLGHVRVERDNQKKLVTAFGDHTPETIQAALTELEELKQKLADSPTNDKSKAQIAAAVKQVSDKLTGELTTAGTQLESHKSVITKLLVDAAALTELNKPEIKGNPNFLLPAIRDQVKVVWEDDQPVARVIDRATGGDRITLQGSGSTAPMQIPELIGLMMQDNDWKAAFGGSQASGPGSGKKNGIENTGSGADGEVKVGEQGSNPVDRLKSVYESKAT